jgi:predicted Fe-Mo cluster-binding NifX family protein
MTSTRFAIVTDDGHTIHAHFGRASNYLIVEAEGERVVRRELVPKLGHRDFQQDQHDGAVDHSHDQPHDHPHGHGHGQGREDRHSQMIEPIRGCQALISGGMGRGIYTALRQAGIDALITDETQVEEIIRQHLAGRLVNHLERLH